MINLDYQCFRDVLKYIKEHLEMPSYADFPTSISVLDVCNAEELSYYAKEQIKYSIRKLTEVEFIQCSGNSNKRPVGISREFIDDITMKGHSFLTNSTNDRIWKKAVESMRIIGMVSFDAFCVMMNKAALNLTMEAMRRMR